MESFARLLQGLMIFEASECFVEVVASQKQSRGAENSKYQY